jgi:cell wall-associated NlpC family hydrolase
MTTTPQVGDFFVVATHHRGLKNKIAENLIRWGTESPVNHAGVYIGGNTIVEAANKVQVSPIDAYPTAIWSTGHILLSDQRRAGIKAAAISYIGEGYNWLDIAAIAMCQKRLPLYSPHEHGWALRRLSNDGHLICSQLVSAAYTQAGVILCPDQLAGLVSPGDLYSVIKAH